MNRPLPHDDDEGAEEPLGILIEFGREANDRVFAERMADDRSRKGASFLAACEKLASAEMRGIFATRGNPESKSPEHVIAALGLEGAFHLRYELDAMEKGLPTLISICNTVIQQLAIAQDEVAVHHVTKLPSDEEGGR